MGQGLRRSHRVRRVMIGLALLVSAAAVLVTPAVPAEALVPAVITYTYEVRGTGNGSDLGSFAALAAETYNDPRGWNMGGTIRFVQVPSGGNFTLWLAAAGRVPGFAPSVCSSQWSCSVGRNVIINETRWLYASPAWNAAGGSGRDYQHMVVNHETGHWLGFGHAGCGGPGQAAPVMQQQSIGLQGCAFNPWPLPWERGAAAGARGVGISDGSPIGTVDSVLSVAGGVRVSGWVIDPDTSAPSQAHVYVDGAPVVGVLADQSRPDVGAAYPAHGGAHGFDTFVPLAPGLHTMCVFAFEIAAPGQSRLMLCRTVVSSDPFGRIDGVMQVPGGVRVIGWVIDPDTAGPTQAHLYVGGEGVAAAASVYRPDLAAAFPLWGGGHGFDVVLPRPGGPQDVCLFGWNLGPGTNTLLFCQAVNLSGDAFGVLDLAAAVPGGVRVMGWAIDPDRTAPTQAHVYIDGVGTALVADEPRPDVAAVFPRWSQSSHGFDAVVGAAPGAHQVCVFAYNATAPGASLLLRCLNLTV